MRKLVVCLDGTGNAVGDRETNVLKLYKTLEDSETQIRHYVMGVGTNDSQWIYGAISQRIRGILGLAFGLGLEDDVLQAYGFLCRHWHTRKQNADALGVDEDEAEADRIYIFGFSRGAYAARVLAGFIHNFGLIDPAKLYMIAPVFRAYRRVSDRHKGEDADSVFQALREYENVLKPESNVPIRCLGLFDTVSSMVRFRRFGHNLRQHGSLMELGTHASVNSNGSVRIVLHALAVDERRSMFRPQFWEPRTYTASDGTEKPVYWGNRFKNSGNRRTQFVQQCWFPGYHSDIGGSPREDHSGIGKTTLIWMLRTLVRAELEADQEDNAEREKKAKAPLHDVRTDAHKLEFRTNSWNWYFKGTRGDDLRTPGGFPYCGPDALAPAHDSIWGNRKPQGSWFWNFLEFAPKSLKRRAKGKPRWFRRGLIRWYLPLYEPRHIPAEHPIHKSVSKRWTSLADYRPPNVDPDRLDADEGTAPPS